MGDYGIKISKDNIDVRTASDHELVFSSAFRSHKIVAASTKTITVSSGVTTAQSDTVAHGLSYVPIAEVYVRHPNVAYEVRVPYAGLPSEMDGDPVFNWKMDGTNLTFYVRHDTSFGSDVTYTFTYIIFTERLI